MLWTDIVLSSYAVLWRDRVYPCPRLFKFDQHFSFLTYHWHARKETAKGNLPMYFPILETKTTPNTATMRSIANFWYGAAGPHAQNTRNLQTNQPFVSASWSGNGAESYSQTNQQVLLGDGRHHSQMVTVADLFTVTAAQYDWGNSLQAMAERQWHAANAFAESGQAEAAALWYSSAVSTQAEANGIITGAQQAFETGMGQLQAELGGLPVTPHESTLTYNPQSSPLPSRPALSNNRAGS